MKNGIIYTRTDVVFLNGIWWSALFIVHAFVMHRLGFSWYTSAADAAVSVVLLGLTSFITVILFRYYKPGSGNRMFRLVFALAAIAVYCVFTGMLMEMLPDLDRGYAEFYESSVPLRAFTGFLVLIIVVLLSWMLNHLSEEKGREHRGRETARLAKEAELARLRQQLQPHFLFNSLNSINSLIARQPEEARKMIHKLSDFLRGTIRKDEQQVVTLTEELAQLGLYLDIEKVRFGDRLNVAVSSDDVDSNVVLPPLLLQPLVENAIKYGVYGTTGKTDIRIAASELNGELSIEISNPIDPAGADANHGAGWGLNSVRRRLYLLYARNDLVQTIRNENIFTTRVRIPQPAPATRNV